MGRVYGNREGLSLAQERGAGDPGPEATQRVSQGPTGEQFAERPCKVLPLGKRHSQSRAKLAEPVRKEFPDLSLLPRPHLAGGGVLKGGGKPLQSHPSGGISSAPPPGRSPDCHLSYRSPGAKGADLLGGQIRSRPGLTQTAVSPTQLHPPLDGLVQPSLLCLEGNV